MEFSSPVWLIFREIFEQMQREKYRKGFVFIFLLIISVGLSAQEKLTREQYIEIYADISMEEMARTGIPASITLAQGCLESDNGNSRLALDAMNHFGIKCHDWTGRKIYHDDDEKDECFRKYKSVEESFKDHSEFLLNKSRYDELFDLKGDDYKAWARGLKKAGYATSNKYADLLIQIIEENELYEYDRIVLAGEVKQKRRKIDHPPLEAGREILLNNRVEYIIAEAGDTPESLREEMDLYPGEIFRYNDIEKDYTIEAGMFLYLQPKRCRAEKGSEEHRLAKDETLWDVSQIYGVRLNRLYRMNRIISGSEPEAGMVLQLRRGIPRAEKTKILKSPNTEKKPGIGMEFDEF